MLVGELRIYLTKNKNVNNTEFNKKRQNMTTPNAEQIKTVVREHYADLVKSGESCCSASNCCDTEINIEASLTGESANQNGYTDGQNFPVFLPMPLKILLVVEIH